MKKFQNILFISQGLTDETNAFKQALSIARNSNAELKVLVICPEFPKEMTHYKERYEASLIEQAKTSIQSAFDAIKLSSTDVRVNIEVESGSTPAVRIIRHVLKNAHDLIIKEAEPKESGKGFKALDMELLRKCPCPVFLSRPISRHRDEIKVAVAIDPESVTPEGHDLSLRLLEISRSYADTCSEELHIVSCWDYEYEIYLRQHPRFKIKGEEVDEIVRDTCNQSRTALNSMIQQAKISGKIHIHHMRGSAEKTIPEHIEENNIDVLIMGTVARTGISGFIMGNTAENIVQKLGCSLLALKPNGFVSPVKAY